MAGIGDSKFKNTNRLQQSWAAVRQALSGGAAAWKYARRLRRAILDASPDVIHSNGIKTHLLTRLAGTSDIPVVWHVHDFYSQRPLVSPILRWAGKPVDGVIAISKAVAQDIQRVLPGLPVRVVYNAIDLNEFSPGAGDGTRLDELAGLPVAGPETVRVGLVATFARWKGQDLFLRALARLVSEPARQPVRFYVIGGPIYHTLGSQFSENELRRLARDLHVERHVGFIGFQDDPAPIYQALDVVVHASTRPEPFGLSIVEAMACARPVIVSRAGGAAELFTHDRDAIGVVPGDAEALASAIRGLVNDPEGRRRLGENARRTARERFNCDRLGPQMLAAYKDICAPAGHPGSPLQYHGSSFL